MIVLNEIVVQVLAHLPPIVSYFLQDMDQKESCIDSSTETSLTWKFGSLLVEFYSKLNKETADISNLYKALKEKMPRVSPKMLPWPC